MRGSDPATYAVEEEEEEGVEKEEKLKGDLEVGRDRDASSNSLCSTFKFNLDVSLFAWGSTSSDLEVYPYSEDTDHKIWRRQEGSRR